MLVLVTIRVLPHMPAVELLDDRKMMMELSVKMRKGIRR